MASLHMQNSDDYEAANLKQVVNNIPQGGGGGSKGYIWL